ncbi:MAG: diguanylate cyclase, partial [Oscillibacter sp.]
IAVDVLKIDMRFLSQSKIPGRGENIIASVIRMAKWLGIPVVTEGVETAEQVEFLKSVGCEYIQGYYFARPMPVSKYEAQFLRQTALPQGAKKRAGDLCDSLFSANPQVQGAFNNPRQATAICEFFEDQVEFLRVNELFCELLNRRGTAVEQLSPLTLTAEKDREVFLGTFRLCAETEEPADCECTYTTPGGSSLWLHICLQYVARVEEKSILVMEVADITTRKEIDLELQKYRASLLSDHNDAHTILIVDDGEINRRILKKIFENKYSCLEAGDGEEAIAVLKENPGEVDLILLDIMMPNMDGKEFLRYKKDTPELDSIPVIMITADDSPEQQIHTLSLGANDYIVKPFIPEVVIRRVRNVLQYNRRFKEIIKEYNTMSQQVKTDLMTGLYNRASAETLITQRLENGTGLHAMLMLDVDNFKKLNDTYGHSYGDRAIRAIAKKLRSLFRENDIVTRMGGDEFSVFMENVPSVEAVERKAQELCQKMSAIQVKGEGAAITCSVGVTIGEGGEDTFETLYKKADKALYNAKCRGKNMLSIYDKELSQAAPNWIHDAETVLNELSDVIYICKKDSYEMLYMNDYACRFFGVTR